MVNLVEPRYLQVLQESFLFQGVPPELAAELLADGAWQAVQCAKDQPLYGTGEWQDYLGILVSGRATAYSAAKSGAAILRSFGPGDVFGAASLYAPQAEPFSHILADQPCEVLFLARAGLQRQLAENWQLAENYISFLAQRVAFLNRKITALTAGSAQAKLAAHILAQSQPNAAGQLVFRGNISKLAQNLGISRASLYRSLDRLAALGCINREGREIMVCDQEGLQEIAP